MRPASLHSRLPWMLLAGAGVVAGLGLYIWVLSTGAYGESALILPAVGTLLLVIAGLLATVGLALRVYSRPVLVRRAVARLVDLCLAAVVGLLVALGIAPLLTDDPGDASELRLVVFLFGVPLLAGLYEVVLVALSGQTVGKMLAGVRIQRLDGTPPGWKASALRAAPLLLVAVPVVGLPLFLLVYLWTVGSRDQRGLHDHLAGTRVNPGPGPPLPCGRVWDRGGPAGGVDPPQAEARSADSRVRRGPERARNRAGPARALALLASWRLVWGRSGQGGVAALAGDT